MAKLKRFLELEFGPCVIEKPVLQKARITNWCSAEVSGTANLAKR